MNKSAFTKILAVAAVFGMLAPAAMADRHYRYHYNRGYYNGYFNQDWNNKRNYLRSNMSRFNNVRNFNNRLTLQQQIELNNMLNSQYGLYRGNNWHGVATWSNYSDPRFLDYMRVQNPSLLSNIMYYLGR